MKRIIVTALVVLCGVSAFAQNVSNTVSSSNTGTIQPAGPRAGANGKKFLNVESASNNAFASYGVIDFNGAGLTFGSPGAVIGLTLSLTEANSAFSKAGALLFYLTGDNATNIDPGSTLKYDATNPPTGIKSTDFNPLYLLGGGTFNTTGNINTGSVDVYSFAVSGAAADLLTAEAGSGNIRILVGANDNAVAATWGGNTAAAGTAPKLQLQAVPEPASLLGLGLAAGLFFAKRRK